MGDLRRGLVSGAIRLQNALSLGKTPLQPNHQGQILGGVRPDFRACRLFDLVDELSAEFATDPPCQATLAGTAF